MSHSLSASELVLPSIFTFFYSGSWYVVLKTQNARIHIQHCLFNFRMQTCDDVDAVLWQLSSTCSEWSRVSFSVYCLPNQEASCDVYARLEVSGMQALTGCKSQTHCKFDSFVIVVNPDPVSADRQMLSHDDLMAIIFSSLAAGRPAKQPARH